MTQKNELNNIIQIIRNITADPLLHLPFAGNIVSAMKPVMLENDIYAFPILCLTGEPQSGKSTIARTIVLDKPGNTSGHHMADIDKSHFYITTDISVSKLKKILKERLNDYIVLDDFADFQDSDSRRKSSRFLDETVRPSFAGTSALLLLTAETKAFSKITGSLLSRMVMLPVDGWKSNAENRILLDSIYHIRPRLSELLQEFSEWASGQSYDIRTKSHDFQQKYRNTMDDRSAEIFFAYDFSMEEFSKFLEKRYGMSFSMEIFRASYMAVWKKSIFRNLTDKQLLMHLFSDLLSTGAFECKIPQVKLLCQKYCNGVCNCSMISDCHGNPGACTSYEQECSSGNYYDPYDLMLDGNDNSAVLIPNMACIYGMPAYKRMPHTPLLIVSQNNLLNMLNHALEKFCLGTGISHNCFSPNRLSTLLKESSMCAARDSGSHQCYIFPYLTETEGMSCKKDAVYILRISQRECKLLYDCSQKKDDPARDFFRQDHCNLERLYNECRKMPQILHGLCKDIQLKYPGQS